MTDSFANDLRRIFTASVPADLSTRGFARNACVAALLRGSSLETLELAFIRRSEAPSDRWSGQVAFPGGGNDPVDADHLATVHREVREEIGVELTAEDYVGRLDDTQARRRGQMLEFYIRPFVFWIDRELDTKLSPDEVADFFWIPIARLKDPKYRTHISFHRESVNLELPAILLPQDPPLWGLTYMMTENLLGVLATAAAERA